MGGSRATITLISGPWATVPLNSGPRATVLQAL